MFFAACFALHGLRIQNLMFSDSECWPNLEQMVSLLPRAI